MALSSQEQNDIITLLGYGLKSIQAGSVIYDKVMNDRLSSITPAGEARVRSFLTQVYALENQMLTAPSRLTAKKVDDIETNLQELEMLRRERKKFVKEIAVQLDIPYVGGAGGINVNVCS